MKRLLLFFFIFFTYIEGEQIKDDEGNYFSWDILHPHYDTSKIKILKYMEHKQFNFTFLMDASQCLFIIKQIKTSSPTMQFKAIREMLSAYIAESNNLPAHRVRIIPAGFALPGKLAMQRPATLHTVVPGYKASHFSRFSEINIQQYAEKSYPMDKWGLRYEIIHSMSLHQILPAIVALDTFIGNDDRNKANFFYDEKSDMFWMIDMEKAYKENLSDLACKFIQKLLNNQLFNFTEAEIKGLIIYRNTLKKLSKNHPPDELHKKLDKFIFQAGIKPGSSLFNNKMIQIIKEYKKKISESYASTQQLIMLLDKLIDRYDTSKYIFNDYEQPNTYLEQQKLCACPIDQYMKYNADLHSFKNQFYYMYITDRIHAYENAFSTSLD